MEVVDFAALARSSQEQRPVWSRYSADLNLNLVVLERNGSVEQHRNEEVDVLLIAFDGNGVVCIDGDVHPLQAGQGIVIPKGTVRSISCASDRFGYLLCHRRRAGLWPAPPTSATGPPEPAR